jgi:Fe2+ or Zn2+ uptake regulation protein
MEGTQEEKVLRFFEQNPDGYFQKHQIHALVMPTALVSSVQRALRNLTRAGYLKKMPLNEKSAISPYGKEVHVWKLKRAREKALEDDAYFGLFDE